MARLLQQHHQPPGDTEQFSIFPTPGGRWKIGDGRGRWRI